MPKLHISFRIEVEKLKTLESIAKQRRKTISSLLRDIIDKYVEKSPLPFFETVPVVLEVYDRMLETLLNLDKLPLEEAATIIYNYFIWKYGNNLNEVDLKDFFEEIKRIFMHFCKVEKFTFRETSNDVIIHIRTASNSQARWVSRLMKTVFNKLRSYKVEVHCSGRSILLLVIL